MFSWLGQVSGPAHFCSPNAGCASGLSETSSSRCDERLTAAASAGLVQRISSAAVITHGSDPVSLQKTKEISAGGPEFGFRAAFLWNL